MKTPLAILSSIIFLNLLGQNANNNWYFGTGAYISFQGETTTAENGNPSMVCLDNGTSVSNPATGELLFYSNGYKVWNKNHEVMPNGHGLLGHNSGGNCAYAVQDPGNPLQFYLFTSDAWAGQNGIRYSIIDMSLDNGNGDIGPIKNNVLLSPATEKILAVRHANGNDVWLITHAWNSSHFHAYLISESGISGSPVVSDVGSVHNGGAGLNYNAAGQIAINRSKNKIACCIFNMGSVELFDFNNVTGTLSNPKILQDPNAWGVAFSPNSEYLYVSHWGGPTKSIIHQYNISLGSEISESLIALGGLNGPNANYVGGYIQKGPNNKIYVSQFQSTYLAEIQNPNLPAPQCSIVSAAVDLGGGICQAGLPSPIDAKASLVSTEFFSNQSVTNSFQIFPNPTSGKFFIESLSENSHAYDIQVLNMNGQLVHEKTNLCEKTIVVDISRYPSGSYVIKLLSRNDEMFSTHIIKE